MHTTVALTQMKSSRCILLFIIGYGSMTNPAAFKMTENCWFLLLAAQLSRVVLIWILERENNKPVSLFPSCMHVVLQISIAGTFSVSYSPSLYQGSYNYFSIHAHQFPPSYQPAVIQRKYSGILELALIISSISCLRWFCAKEKRKDMEKKEREVGKRKKRKWHDEGNEWRNLAERRMKRR